MLKFLIFLGCVILFIGYFIPTIIAFKRDLQFKWVIFSINIFGFHPFIWLVAIVWALWPSKKS